MHTFGKEYKAQQQRLATKMYFISERRDKLILAQKTKTHKKSFVVSLMVNIQNITFHGTMSVY